MERFRQRRAHPRPVPGGQDDDTDGPDIGGGGQRIVALGINHAKASGGASPLTAVSATRAGDGWRARIRTWNKGSKDPCDTISPPANGKYRSDRRADAGMVSAFAGRSIPASFRSPLRRMRDRAGRREPLFAATQERARTTASNARRLSLAKKTSARRRRASLRSQATRRAVGRARAAPGSASSG